MIQTSDPAHRALMDARRRWDDARAEAEAARLALNAAIRRSTLPQAEIAATLGWPRQRVHEVVRG